MFFCSTRALSYLSGLLLSIVATTSVASPNVVASIKPVHSWVAAVMQGVSNPALLVAGNVSPHDFSMKPSDAKLLSSANLVVLMGKQLETFLTKPIESLDNSIQVLTLLDLDPNASIPVDSKHENHSHDHSTHNAGVDEHRWLDVDFAKHAVEMIAEKLSEIDPGNASIYEKNAAEFKTNIEKTEVFVSQLLSEHSDKKFAVMHDAYASFESHFQLEGGFVLAPSNYSRPGAKNIRLMQQKVKLGEFDCIFVEPQTNQNLLDLVADMGEVRLGTLDPSGSQLDSGPLLYFELIETIGRNMAECFSTN